MIEEIKATEMISGISQKSYYLQGIELLLDLIIVANWGLYLITLNTSGVKTTKHQGNSVDMKSFNHHLFGD